MSGLQSSFNRNCCHWEGKKMTNTTSYSKNRGHVPANQFLGFMSADKLQAQARAAQAETQHEAEDHLVFTFMIFFLIYALCRITL
jgi:hypothetical protein